MTPGVPYAEVIGDPIAHSKSPLIHGFWIGKLGLAAEYRAVRVTPADLTGYLASRKEDPLWRGCSVTMPLKQRVLDQLPEIRDDGVGAVNCIVPTPAGLVGYNTDVTGVREALAAGQQVPCEHHVSTLVDLVGTGGAARAVLAALRGLDVTVYGRDQARADSLSDEFGPGSTYGYSAHLSTLMAPAVEHDPAYPDLQPNRGATQRYDYILINATCLGMTGQAALPVRLDRYPTNTVVFDMVYDPVETPLLREAKALGMNTVSGLVMLVGQAAQAFELFFCIPAPREHDAELCALLTA